MIKHTTIESAVLSFARIQAILNNSKKLDLPEYRAFVIDVLYHLKHKTKNCDLGMLWNALTEKDNEEVLIGLSKPEDKFIIHADSGGLQQITLGIKVDEAGKQGIYKRQAKFSTDAMSFDKMPIMVDESRKTENVSMSLDHSAKYFVRELLYDVGRESGYNVLDQCKAIAKIPKEEVNAKILVIIQGSKFSDYQEYARGLFSVFNELPEDERETYYDLIGGLSMGMSGITNYFDLIDLYCRAPKDLTAAPEKLRKTIHFLGVGGPTKVAPLYAIKPNFFGDRDIHYTFDSTSRTSCSTYGRFTENTKTRGHIKLKTCNLGRSVTPQVYKHLEDVKEEFGFLLEKHFPHYDISDIDKFRNIFSPYRDDKLRLSKELIKKYGDRDGSIAYMNCTSINDFLHWCIELVKFFELLDEYSTGEFRAINNKPLRHAINTLFKCETYEDYMQPAVREFMYLTLKDIKLGNINIVETVQDFENKKTVPMDEEGW